MYFVIKYEISKKSPGFEKMLEFENRMRKIKSTMWAQPEAKLENKNVFI